MEVGYFLIILKMKDKFNFTENTGHLKEFEISFYPKDYFLTKNQIKKNIKQSKYKKRRCSCAIIKTPTKIYNPIMKKIGKNMWQCPSCNKIEWVMYIK